MLAEMAREPVERHAARLVVAAEIDPVVVDVRDDLVMHDLAQLGL